MSVVGEILDVFGSALNLKLGLGLALGLFLGLFLGLVLFYLRQRQKLVKNVG